MVPDLVTPLVGSWHDQPVLYLDKGLPWLLVPYDQDPLRQSDGGYPFPADVRRQLERVNERGVRFDDLAIAHELDPVGPIKSLIRTIPHQGIACDSKAAAVLIGDLPATGTTHKVGRALESAPRAIKTLLKGVAQAPAMLLPLLDPIIFGVLHIKADKTDLSLWYPLAAWKW